MRFTLCRSQPNTRLVPSFLVMWGFFLFLPACSTRPIVSQMIVDDAARMVRVDVTYRTGQVEHSHPADISPQVLNQAFQSVLVEPSSILPVSFGRRDSETEAFSHVNREFLASHASQALSRATPLEEVVFFWVNSRGNPIREITSGSLYVQDGELHVVFANYHQTTSSQGDVERARQNPLEVLGQPLYHVVPGPGGRLASESTWERWFSQPRQHSIIPLSQVSLPVVDREERNSEPSRAPQATPTSLREKLQELQTLQEEGLISEEEYQGKRRELLDRF